jgi:hypothetical protein
MQQVSLLKLWEDYTTINLVILIKQSARRCAQFPAILAGFNQSLKLGRHSSDA